MVLFWILKNKTLVVSRGISHELIFLEEKYLDAFWKPLFHSPFAFYQIVVCHLLTLFYLLFLKYFNYFLCE